MLDDLSSLPTLFGSMDGCGWWCGVLTGSTGPTGRPFSLITFALQQPQWPDAFYFKFVNLCIHLANASLVYLVFRAVLRRLSFVGSAHWLAALAALIWAVWPIQVSSVLYVIQRMTLLSSFFVLLGIWLFLYYRERIDQPGASLRNWCWLVLSLGVTGISAIFSKESGVLLLVYVLILELALFPVASAENRHHIKIFRWLCIYIPILAVVTFVLLRVLIAPDWAYLSRDFTLNERLLTQGRILFDYLSSTLFPRVTQLGLYHDDYQISRSLVAPFTTLLALIGLILMIVTAWLVRKRLPLLSLTVFWFLGGHLLESTVLPLELYFEHRNYLAIMMIALFLTTTFSLALKKVSSSFISIVLWVMGGSYLLLILGMTFGQASLWGDELRYSIVQAKEHPTSIRARSLEINILSGIGMLDESFERLQEVKRDFPGISGMIVANMDFHCIDSRFELDPLEEVTEALKHVEFGYGAIKTISDYLRLYDEGGCRNVSPAYALGIVRALQQNPKFARKADMISGYEARLLGLLGRYTEASAVFSAMSLSEDDWPIYIRYLAMSGQQRKGVEVADKALAALGRVPHYDVYRKEVTRLREVLITELNEEKIHK